MNDIKALRENANGERERLLSRGVSPGEIDELLELDSDARARIAERDEIRGRINSLSKEVSEAMRSGDKVRADALRNESRALGQALDVMQSRVVQAEEARLARVLLIPNVPSVDAPVGASEDENVVLRYWSPEHGVQDPDEYVAPVADDAKKAHWEIGESMRLLDLPRAARISGSMFAMYRGDGARLLRALTSFALDAHSDAFEEIRPPTLVKSDTMIATGHLPKFADDAYELPRDDLYAIPTAEVPLTSFARDEILDEAELPLRLTAATACYRREAGSAGRDTRGLLRLHEFDKVELFAYCAEAQAPEVHLDMLRRAEGILRALGITYRVVDLCTGDMGASAARTFDLEAYAPGVGKWLEVSSVSWCGDYQARRANIRYRASDGSGNRFVHTLNGSALAWARVWAIIVEMGYREEGAVEVPQVLVPYLGGRTTLSSS
ncbi:MAG: serine--tRNA ligase [Acidimicrobiales bacterium]